MINGTTWMLRWPAECWDMTEAQLWGKLTLAEVGSPSSWTIWCARVRRGPCGTVFVMNGEFITARREKALACIAVSLVDKMHDDAIKWKHFPRHCPFMRGIHGWPVSSPHKGQWRGAFKFSWICSWIYGWVNNREAGDLRRHRANSDVTVKGNTTFRPSTVCVPWIMHRFCVYMTVIWYYLVYSCGDLSIFVRFVSLSYGPSISLSYGPGAYA